MTLASFPLLVKRWRQSHLFHANYDKYSQLGDYLPEDEFRSRLAAIDRHVKTEYPHIWLDSILFTVAIIFVVATAIFSVIARSIDLAMWYPLLLLIVPIAIGFITTKRKNDQYHKLIQYYESLQNCLKEFNSLDVTRQIKWHFRKLRDTDTSVDLCLKKRLAFYNINFVIDIVQVDTENELAEEGEILPAYGTSMQDIVLDIGPEMDQVPGNTPHYTLSGRTTSNSLPQPPAYGRHEISMELALIPPPPAYPREPRNSAVPMSIPRP